MRMGPCQVSLLQVGKEGVRSALGGARGPLCPLPLLSTPLEVQVLVLGLPEQFAWP